MALPRNEPEPGPTSLPLPDPAAYSGEPREYARALMQRKDQIDKEIVRGLTIRSLHYQDY